MARNPGSARVRVPKTDLQPGATYRVLIDDGRMRRRMNVLILDRIAGGYLLKDIFYLGRGDEYRVPFEAIRSAIGSTTGRFPHRVSVVRRARQAGGKRRSQRDPSRDAIDHAKDLYEGAENDPTPTRWRRAGDAWEAAADALESIGKVDYVSGAARARGVAADAYARADAMS